MVSLLPPSVPLHTYRLERRGNLEAATRCYREALADDPQEETARLRLEIITTAMEKKVGGARGRGYGFAIAVDVIAPLHHP